MYITFTIATTAAATTATAAVSDDRGYSVPMECRDDLARTRGLPVCSEVDLTRMLPPCELREPKDTQVLIQVAAVSGSLEVRPRNLGGSISDLLPLVMKSQESKQDKQGQFVARISPSPVAIIPQPSKCWPIRKYIFPLIWIIILPKLLALV